MWLTRILMAMAIMVPLNLLSAPSRAAKAGLNIGAAVSLREPLREILPSHLPAGWEARMIFAGSNALLRQMQHDGNFAILITADALTMQEAIRLGFVKKGDEVPLAHNEVWLASARKDAPSDPLAFATLQIPAAQKIAVPGESVPLGQYAASYLKDQKLWDTWQSHLVYVENAEASVTWLRRRIVPWAFIYASDGKRLQDELAPLATLPHTSAWLATYYAAPTQKCPDLTLCRRLVDSLRDDQANAVWAKQGFLPLQANENTRR